MAGGLSEGLYAWVYRRWLWPAWEAGLRRRPTLDHLARLERSQWLAPEEIDRQQVQALRLVLAHAGAHVPYYRELFGRLGFDARDVTRREHLAALPVLTREILRERAGDLVDPALAGRDIVKGTSGTTGVRLVFEYSPSSEYWRRAVRLRAYGWAGYRIGRPTFFYWSMAHGPGGLKIRADRLLRRETYRDSIHQDEPSLRAACAAIARSDPHLIVCFTRAGAELARFAVDRGLRRWGEIPVVCGAEAVLPADRIALERAFGPVFETYGARETMLIAAECEAHAGLHVADENLVVEVIAGGAPAAPGQSGEVVLTDLHNIGMPLIRYAIGDLATLAPGPAEGGRPCPCGRGLRRLAHVDGRRTDTLRDRDGAPIPGLALFALFAEPLDIAAAYQAVQAASGRVVLRVVPGRDFTRARLDDIAHRLRDYLRGQPLAVEVVARIAPDAGGKHRAVVREEAPGGGAGAAEERGHARP